MKVAVVDIETLAQAIKAKIMAIGAVVIDLESLTIEDEFYIRITRNCKFNNERLSDEGTLKFWKSILHSGNKEAWDEIFVNTDRHTLLETLNMFMEFLEKHFHKYGDVNIYGNGPEFDCSILTDAYTSCGIATPWEFWMQDSIRTAGRMYLYKHGVKLSSIIPFKGVKHHALHDARYEASLLIEAVKDYVGEKK